MSPIIRIHPIYRWLALGCLVLTGLLGWSLRQGLRGDDLFFFLTIAAITVWFGHTLCSQIRLNERSIVLQTPLRGVQEVEFRQLVSVMETGRFMKSLSLLYYARQPDGLLDLDRVHHLLLPAVVDQENLLTTIQARIPQ